MRRAVVADDQPPMRPNSSQMLSILGVVNADLSSNLEAL
jgi:hypothetical protein